MGILASPGSKHTSAQPWRRSERASAEQAQERQPASAGVLSSGARSTPFRCCSNSQRPGGLRLVAVLTSPPPAAAHARAETCRVPLCAHIVSSLATLRGAVMTVQQARSAEAPVHAPPQL